MSEVRIYCRMSEVHVQCQCRMSDVYTQCHCRMPDAYIQCQVSRMSEVYNRYVMSVGCQTCLDSIRYIDSMKCVGYQKCHAYILDNRITEVSCLHT